MTHEELIRRLGRRSQLPEGTVRVLLSALRDVLHDALVQQETVPFRTLFRISTATRTLSVAAPGKPRRRVQRLVLTIRPMEAFRDELRQWGIDLPPEEEPMDKFGVVIDPSLDKTASTQKGCPTCGSKVEMIGNTPCCVKCGTAPFEPKKEKK